MTDIYDNLESNTYLDSEELLIKNIHSIDLLDTLKNEKLSIKFIIDYILNPTFQTTRKERDITIETVAFYQPHLFSIIKRLI